MGALLGLGGCGTSSVHRAGRPPAPVFPVVSGLQQSPSMCSPLRQAGRPRCRLSAKPVSVLPPGRLAGGGRRVFSSAHPPMVNHMTPVTIECSHAGGAA